MEKLGKKNREDKTRSKQARLAAKNANVNTLVTPSKTDETAEDQSMLQGDLNKIGELEETYGNVEMESEVEGSHMDDEGTSDKGEKYAEVDDIRNLWQQDLVTLQNDNMALWQELRAFMATIRFPNANGRPY